MDEPTGLDIKNKALRAQLLADSAAFQEFIKDAEIRIVEQWKAAETPDQREVCHSMLRGVRALEDALNAAIGAGQVEEFLEAKNPRPLA